MSESARHQNTADAADVLADALGSRIAGDVRVDRLSRTIYATDASMYEIIPLGVVVPKSVHDVVATVEECRKAGVSIVARGAGTGLTGGAIGPGLQLDMSRYMTAIDAFDKDARTIEVEPGVVLDELNAWLAPHGLQFGADVATSNRATLGGMIANNSCGARSIVYGRTVDHILSLTAVLADGQAVTFHNPNCAADESSRETDARAAEIVAALGRLRDGCFEEIQARYPKILRSNGGYALDRLGPRGSEANAIGLLCGSEGTLGVVVRAKLNLVPVPKQTGLLILHFNDVLEALAATPAVLEHKPSAVELVDRLIIEAGREFPALRGRCDFLEGDPAALLVVEFPGDDTLEVFARLDALKADTAAIEKAYVATKLIETDRQADMWAMRKAGLGLLMSKPGDAQWRARTSKPVTTPMPAQAASTCDLCLTSKAPTISNGCIGSPLPSAI